jgi:hypothetical protein
MPTRAIYKCDDSGAYYCAIYDIVGEDDTVVWFAAHHDLDFANVLWGRLLPGGTVEGFRGEWWDIPFGRAWGHGTLEGRYGSGTDVRRHSATGGFGGEEWRQTDESRHSFVRLPRPEVRRNPELTGVWETNQGALYYVRQYGHTVVWFGSIESRAFANCFKGTVTDSEIDGEWIDVPYGRTEGRGSLRLK